MFVEPNTNRSVTSVTSNVHLNQGVHVMAINRTNLEGLNLETAAVRGPTNVSHTSEIQRSRSPIAQRALHDLTGRVGGVTGPTAVLLGEHS